MTQHLCQLKVAKRKFALKIHSATSRCRPMPRAVKESVTVKKTKQNIQTHPDQFKISSLDVLKSENGPKSEFLTILGWA